MDGYIKNKKEAIWSIRKGILSKYMVAFLILIMIPVWLIGMATAQPPEKWTQTEIVFSYFAQEYVGLQRWRSLVLYSQDGDKYVAVKSLEDQLTSGKAYTLVYSEDLLRNKYTEALWDGYTVFLDRDDSIAQWKAERREAVIAICITIGIEIVALILIDRLWCKKEYAQIKALKEKIALRVLRQQK